MDWSLAFLLVISLLVTYASLLLVGLQAAGLTPPLPSFLLPILILATEGGANSWAGGRYQPGKPTSVTLLPSWCPISPTTLCPQVLALLLRLCRQPLHLHSLHKVQ